MRNVVAWFCSMILLSCPVVAQENQHADLLLTPTRVVLSAKDRFATINVKNSGGATGQYTLELQDMAMDEQGVIRPLAAGETQEGSAKDLLRISPRSMTLKPGQIQNVRILIRNANALKEGEYRSHLKVRIANDNVDKALKAEEAPEGGIAVRENLALVIPVIVRQGKLEFASEIQNPSLVGAGKQQQVAFTLTRSGNRSSMGDVSITYTPASGKSLLVGTHPGIPVYFPNSKRQLTLPLNVPKGVALKGGKIDITYTAQKDEGGKELARASFTP